MTITPLQKFHYTMTHDEFGNSDFTNNYYVLFSLIFGYMIFMKTCLGIFLWGMPQ